MAKGKHSAALFEVIVPTKSVSQARERRPGMFRSIAGWLRSRPRGGGGGGSLPLEISRPAPEPVYEPAPLPRRVSMPEPLAISLTSPSIDEPRAPRRDFALRLNMTTGVIAMLALGTVVGAAFIAGRRMVLGPKPLISATSSESLRMNPPTPSVTQVLPRTAVQVSDPADRAIPGGGTLPRSNAVSSQQPPKQSPAAGVIRGLPRRSKVNYVIIQSYPLQERPMAEEAKAVLTKAGIECTIEKDLWKGWYSVVGTEGFETISKNPALDQYTNRIKQISKEAHDKKRSFKAFRPMPILWK